LKFEATPLVVDGVMYANLPGASPDVMASAVATPLERMFGRIAGITEMTSNSNLGSSNVTLQFDLNRNIDAAARDVQAAINAARGQLPVMPSNPGYRKINPADSPVLILALTSDIVDRSKMYDIADSVLAQRLAQVKGVGQVSLWGSSKPAVRVQVNPGSLTKYDVGWEQVTAALNAANTNRPKVKHETHCRNYRWGPAAIGGAPTTLFDRCAVQTKPVQATAAGQDAAGCSRSDSFASKTGSA
jgi:multidrug efflux pump